MKDLLKISLIISYLAVVFLFNFVGFYGSMYPFFYNYFPGSIIALKDYAFLFVRSNMLYLLGNMLLPLGVLLTLTGRIFFKKRFSSEQLVRFLFFSFRAGFILTTVTPLVNAVTFTYLIPNSMTPSWFRFILNGIALIMFIYFKPADFFPAAEEQ